MKLAPYFGIPLLMVLAACTGASRAEPLDGSRWRLHSGLQGLVDEVEVTLEFGQGDAVSGSGGCNRYSGTLERADGKVGFGPVAATKRGCFGAAGTVETEYFAALGRVEQIERNGDELLLTGRDGLELRFRPLP